MSGRCVGREGVLPRALGTRAAAQGEWGRVALCGVGVNGRCTDRIAGLGPVGACVGRAGLRRCGAAALLEGMLGRRGSKAR